MGYQLHPDLSFARFETDLIFLDLSRDRYFRLGAREAQAFVRLIDDEADDRDISALQRLVRHVPGSGVPAPVSMALPARQYDSHPDLRVSAVATLCALTSQLRAGWLTRHRPLARIVRGLRRVGVSKCGGADKMSSIVAAHARADLLYSAHDRCLAKSIALYVTLRRAGVSAQLVFGVAAKPFAAHCWVQAGDRLVNGELAVTRLFSPILVIE